MNAPIPQGIEVLVKKASVDADFRELLLTRPTDAAGQIGLALTAAESLMLAAVPRGQLEAIIAQVSVPQEHRRAFLGKAAAAMLAALGVVAVSDVALAQGIRPSGARLPADIQPDQPNAPPADQAPEKKDPAEKKDKPDELEKQVIEIVAKQLQVKEPKEITKDQSLVDDLGATTSALVRLRKALEKKFKIKLPGDKFKKVRSVGDVVSIVRGAVKEKAAAASPQPANPQPQPQPTSRPAIGGMESR